MILGTLLSWAVVTLSSSFMRTAPDYESALDNQLLMGALVETQATERYWVKVKAEDYTGWVTEYGLKLLTDSEKAEYLKAPKFICTAGLATVYDGPGKDAGRICELCMGDLVRKTDVLAQGCRIQVLLPDGRLGWVRKCALKDFRSLAEKSATADDIVKLACSFVGTPYMWGGNTSKYFDCSGLVKFCFFLNGILLPRNASQQCKCGTPVKGGQYMPGDLLFFGSSKPLKVTHVAIYIGDGRIVQSSQAVRIDSLKDYGREVVAATRIISDNGCGGSRLLNSPYYFNQDGK